MLTKQRRRGSQGAERCENALFRMPGGTVSKTTGSGKSKQKACSSGFVWNSGSALLLRESNLPFLGDNRVKFVLNS